MIKTLVGNSTGNSLRLAKEAEKELKKWGKDNDIILDIEAIALEGSGKILERVNHSLTLLDNWLPSLTNCDYLFIAGHSQGVAVAIHVISRLLTAGYLDQVEKIGLLATSGMFLGPFSNLDSNLTVKSYTKLENEVLMEMFDFQDSETPHSKEIVRHLNILLQRGVKMTFAGSADDQLVPLYSSLCCQINHPNIFRIAYVDDNAKIPTFLTNLLNLILTLKNLGHSDHELLVEISSFMQGSVGTNGHSKLIDQPAVYAAAISNFLETSTLTARHQITETHINVKEFNFNQYHLPWCLRGFLHELTNLKHVEPEQLILKLVHDYRDWDPSSKTLKDMKYCIEILETEPLSELCDNSVW